MSDETPLPGTEIVLLETPYARVSDRAVVLASGTFAPAQVRRVWLETRQPGQIFGGGMALTGVFLVLRGGGLLIKLLGVALVAIGVVKARAAVHTLMVQQHGEADGRPVLRTANAERAKNLLAAIEQARRAPH